ncbi:unnamed protein product [Rangifer tarandus platyrhynchus]|uniref:Uncharacterized protein n=1 Tax=Rangifer tarandus platyrhynchus TaxID=3082113 RepID=A0ABN8Y3K9_RANTA|nr:unnamed protein product [Rangifer tarandus platyrhynchus]
MGTKEVSPGGTSSTALAPFVTHIACQGTRGIARVHAAPRSCCSHQCSEQELNPGVSSLSRVGVEVGPPGPLTAGLRLLMLILALNLVSRIQTPAGSLLCVQTWPGLGQDDGPRRTVDVSEWELTAHLPGPTYAGPATPSPSSGLAGGAGGLVAVTGPGERLGLSACSAVETPLGGYGDGHGENCAGLHADVQAENGDSDCELMVDGDSDDTLMEPSGKKLKKADRRGKKARGAGQERGAERRRRRPERERRARRWRRPRRNERGAGEPVAQAAAPRTGRARARAPRIARSPGIRTSRASGGRRQAGGGEGTCARRRVRFPGASRLGLERAGGGGGRRSPRSGRAPVSAAGDAGRSWGFATRPIKSSPAVPLLPGKLRGWSSELGPPPPPPPPASSGGGDGIWQISARPHRAG